MNRLTHARANGIKTGYWSPNKKEELVQRLAAYEDTGLEPEEIEVLKRIRTPMTVNEIHIDEYYCPACGGENNCNDGIVTNKYCPQCGQKLEAGEPE